MPKADESLIFDFKDDAQTLLGWITLNSGMAAAINTASNIYTRSSRRNRYPWSLCTYSTTRKTERIMIRMLVAYRKPSVLRQAIDRDLDAAVGDLRVLLWNLMATI